jgi:hypothetical protein
LQGGFWRRRLDFLFLCRPFEKAAARDFPGGGFILSGCRYGERGIRLITERPFSFLVTGWSASTKQAVSCSPQQPFEKPH